MIGDFQLVELVRKIKDHIFLDPTNFFHHFPSQGTREHVILCANIKIIYFNIVILLLTIVFNTQIDMSSTKEEPMKSAIPNWSKQKLEGKLATIQKAKEKLELKMETLELQMENLDKEEEKIAVALRRHDTDLYWKEKRNEWKKYLPEMPAVPRTVVVPEYRAWSDGQNSRNYFHVAYNNGTEVKMSISDRPDSSAPGSFKIEDEKLPDLFLLKICYETFPRSAEQLEKNILVDIFTMLTRARKLLGESWNDDWDFGLVMFRDWVRHFYRLEGGVVIWEELDGLAYCGDDQFVD